MSVKQVTKYVTSDGKIFDSGEEANNHDRKIVFLEQLLENLSIEKLVKNKKDILNSMIELVCDKEHITHHSAARLSYLLMERTDSQIIRANIDEIVQFISDNRMDIVKILIK